MTDQRLIISPEKFDAVIFDMDGVVTRTAHVHSAAWKKMFDHFLNELATRQGKRFEPFDIATDYTRYVDGKPRYDGVRDFLASRGIELREGTRDDDPYEETICGLGNRKNFYFNEVLEEKGARSYDSTVRVIKDLKRAGIKTAIISASKNARKVLASAGVADLFDARVDGLDAEEMGIPGKPAPDVFLAAAKKLGVAPRRSVLVEDAQSGVEAGRAGGFGLVIGVDRAGQRAELARYADVVVDDLSEVRVAPAPRERTTDALPSALDRFNDISCLLKRKRPALFLDYDGTLTPIVERPEDAAISDEMRQTVRDLAGYCTVAIVSGRDRRDVEKLAGIEGIYYAGSHGFDIAGPAGEKMEFEQGKDYLPALDNAEKGLHQRLDGIDGAQVERKKFAIAVHFRRVAESDRPQVEEAVDEVLAVNPGLCKTGGKMIFELRPDIDWHKGKALSWLLQKLDLDRRDVVPIYLGDDLTDEDALREIENQGIGILVRDEDRPTHARYALEDTAEVRIFLQTLCDYLEELNTS
ncbi:trehalose 6-phosphatase [Desulfuromonas soudanensis]|uniref:Trehalose 6-phosphate phosphatase n=1 Tax=Desulfuromonas soudanensis TaxID=1603606 RepID=A0A0M4D9B4_9BACT|nr:trehalose-phosphatase [Desulfuromonas soudanensis]ALC16505.1 trehalose 6-phosphatase [Desulfuromonas soudanensis]